jgi:putative transposase
LQAWPSSRAKTLQIAIVVAARGFLRKSHESGAIPIPVTAVRVEIVRKPADQVGFAVHLHRWVVERFLAWLGRNRRLAKDFEATNASAQAFLYAASVNLLLRRFGHSI